MMRESPHSVGLQPNRRMMMITCKFEVLSKDRVDSLLSMNTNNRILRPKVVDAYARDMASGAWSVTHQGIAISDDGVVIDGQHRLHALKKAGYPKIQMMVVTGLPMDVQKHVDQQAKRTIRDVLRLSFDACFSRYAPAIARAILQESNKHSMPTASEICAFLESNLDVIEAVTSVKGVASDKFFNAGYLAGFVKVGIDRPDRIADVLKFISDVYKGEMLNRKDPAFHLRNHILNTHGSTGGGGLIDERMAKTQKATNAYLDGKDMGILRA
jgi:hypothetical protein